MPGWRKGATYIYDMLLLKICHFEPRLAGFEILNVTYH